MPLSEIDFGKSILPLKSEEDAFFVDTNVLVAYFHEGHKKHRPCFLFLTYLIKNEIMLCTSEIVIVELINSLARVLYIDDRLTQYKEAYPNESSRTYREKQNRYKVDWSSQVIKHDHETLKRYNTEAISKIEHFVRDMVLFECSQPILDDIFVLMCESPLASADAMILSTAINHGLPYVVSIDKDMQVSNSMDILYTEIKNENFEIERMLAELDVKEYLVEQIGEKEFQNKFSA